MAEQAMRATLDFSADSSLSLLDFACLLVCSFGIVVVIYKALFFVHGVFGVLWIGGFATDMVCDHQVAAAVWLSGCSPPPPPPPPNCNGEHPKQEETE